MYAFQTAQSGEIPGDRSLAFRTDALREISWLYVVWLLIASGLSLFVYQVWNGSPISSVQPSLLVYYLILTVHVIYRLKGDFRTNIVSPDILFLLLYTMFHLGYVTLYGLGLVDYEGKIFVFENSIPKSLFIINLGLISFLLGHEIIGSRSSSPKVMGHIRIPMLSWCIFGLIFMAIAVSAHLIVVIFMAPYTTIYGYTALQRIDEYSNSFLLTLLWRNVIHLMTLGLIIYTVASALRYGRLFKSKLAFGLVILYFLLVILEGDRGPILQLGAPLLLVRHYLVKPIRGRYLAVLAVAVLVVFSGLAMVRTTVFKPKEMFQEYKYQKDTGAITWMNPFVEMGSSFLVVNITSHEVPVAEPYWKGASWRDATIQIVPFLRGITFRRGLAKLSPSEWITSTYYGSQASGRAFTVAAEGYLNFGYPGVILELMFFGMFIRWLTVRFSKNPSATWGVIMMACIGISAMAIRGHVGLMFSVCVHLIVVAALLNVLIGYEPSPYEEEEDVTTLPHDDMSYPQLVN